jgi:hypothetical protein
LQNYLRIQTLLAVSLSDSWDPHAKNTVAYLFGCGIYFLPVKHSEWLFIIILTSKPEIGES